MYFEVRNITRKERKTRDKAKTASKVVSGAQGRERGSLPVCHVVNSHIRKALELFLDRLGELGLLHNRICGGHPSELFIKVAGVGRRFLRAKGEGLDVWEKKKEGNGHVQHRV